MGLISGLTTVDIVYTTFIENKEFSVTKFKTVQELKAYFQEHKREGEVVGYVIVKNRTPGFKDYILTGKLSLEWNHDFGYVCKDFNDVFDMVAFLKEYPILAEAVGYGGVPK